MSFHLYSCLQQDEIFPILQSKKLRLREPSYHQGFRVYSKSFRFLLLKTKLSTLATQAHFFQKTYLLGLLGIESWESEAQEKQCGLVAKNSALVPNSLSSNPMSTVYKLCDIDLS